MISSPSLTFSISVYVYPELLLLYMSERKRTRAYVRSCVCMFEELDLCKCVCLFMHTVECVTMLGNLLHNDITTMSV